MMVHNSKKKALYEVIGRAGAKPGYEQLHSPAGQPQPAQQQASPPNAVHWVRKPRFMQFNTGRIEFSIPYQVGIAVALAALLILVVMFRLGERLGSKEVAVQKNPVQTNSATVKQPTAAVSKPAVQTLPAGVKLAKEMPKVVETRPEAANVPQTNAAQTPVSTGRNRIVIQMYQVRSHLEPAKEYFDKLGVATEIIEKNSWFYLVTKNKYVNPDKAGSDGYQAKQKIIELGASYKAPPGFETFGPKPFNDAYGMRFED
jgi:hypothetical protein